MIDFRAGLDWRKIASAAALVAAAVLVPAPSADAQDFYGTLKKINDSNSITLGHRDSSHPFSYYDDKKQPVGIALDLCNAILEQVKKTLKKDKLEVKYISVNPQTRIALMANNTVDLECGSTTNTLGRAQQVEFSAVYFTTGTKVMARKSLIKQLNAKEIEDLQGKSIGLAVGSTNERAVKAMIDAGKLKNVRILAVKDHAEGLLALETDRIDGYATDDILLYGLLHKSRMKNEFEVFGRYLSYDPYGLMMRRDDSAFRLLVNTTLARLFRSGEFDRLYAKWFDPIGVPMSPLLKAAIELQALPE